MREWDAPELAWVFYHVVTKHLTANFSLRRMQRGSVRILDVGEAEDPEARDKLAQLRGHPKPPAGGPVPVGGGGQEPEAPAAAARQPVPKMAALVARSFSVGSMDRLLAGGTGARPRALS